MQISIFTIAPGQVGAAEELNRFLRGHRVLTIDRSCHEGVWSICVTWQPGGTSGEGGAVRTRPEKIDYKEVLDAPTFALFAALREVRKNLAEKEALPHYAIFTNEQLAGIAKTRPTSAGALEKLEGIGPSRVEKYGPAVLKTVADHEKLSHPT